MQRYSVDNMLNLLAVSLGDLVQWLVVLSSSWVALVPWERPWGDSGERGREEKSDRSGLWMHTGHKHTTGIHTTMGGKRDRHFDLVWCTLKSPS